MKTSEADILRANVLRNSASGLIAARNKAYKKPNKYHNKKVQAEGFTFDSQKEYREYLELKQRKQIGDIKDFWHHYIVKLIVNEKLICKVIVDFKIQNNDDSITYEDIKAYNKKTGKYIVTTASRLKYKLFTALHNAIILYK
jgi:hypothetical protein